MNNTGNKDQIDWYTVPASLFPNGMSDVADAIVNEKAWAAVASASYGSEFELRADRAFAYSSFRSDGAA